MVFFFENICICHVVILVVQWNHVAEKPTSPRLVVATVKEEIEHPLG